MMKFKPIYFQGDLGDTTAAQAVLVIPNVQNNPGHAGIFGGQILSNSYAALANQQATPGALFLSGTKPYKFTHYQKNVAQTGYEGFKLQFTQMPCNSANILYESSGLQRP